MKKTQGYALAFEPVVQYVADAMDRAEGALSIADLARDYVHIVPSDFARLRRHEGCTTDQDCRLFLVRRAIRELELYGKKRQVEVDDDTVHLLVPFEELRWQRKKITRPPRNAHLVFDDPFNPMSGRYSENIRKNTGKDDYAALRASMQEFGWLPQYPAIVDERGVVLVGHRRMAVARELGVEPVVLVVRLGSGDEADWERLRHAIASNVGHRPLSPGERDAMAVELYRGGLTQQAIAKILGVSQASVSAAIPDDIIRIDNVSDRVDTLGRKKSPGRPRKPRPEDEHRELYADVRARVQNDEPVSRPELAKKHGVGMTAVQHAHIAERARAEHTMPTRPRTNGNATCRCPNCGNEHPKGT